MCQFWGICAAIQVIQMGSNCSGGTKYRKTCPLLSMSTYWYVVKHCMMMMYGSESCSSLYPPEAPTGIGNNTGTGKPAVITLKVWWVQAQYAIFITCITPPYVSWCGR